MEKLTTTIKLEFLREIASGRKRVEYREIKPYWTRKLGGVRPPFHLRLINGMQREAPEVTVRVRRVRKNVRSGSYELHFDRVFNVRHWDTKRGEPERN